MKEKTEEEEMEEMFESDDENIRKTMRKAKRMIEDVHFNLELVRNDECDKCHHVKPKIIKVVAMIGFKSKNGLVIDSWWQQYCLDCMSNVAEEKIEIEDKFVEGYT